MIIGIWIIICLIIGIRIIIKYHKSNDTVNDNLIYFHVETNRLEISISDPFSMRYDTMGRCPSKQAALIGVELVNVVQLTSAPLSTRYLTIFRCPVAAAHHSADAPVISLINYLLLYNIININNIIYLY